MPSRLNGLKSYFFKNGLLINLALAALYFQTARWSLLLAFPGSNASPVWPPSGIALGIIFLLGFRVWPAIFTGAFLANILLLSSNLTAWSYSTVLSCLLIASGNTIEALAAVWLIKYLKYTDYILSYPQNIFKFIISVLLACTIAASFGVASLHIAGLLPENYVIKVWMNWWLGDVAGIVVITPFILVWFTKKYALPQRASPLEIIATILAVSGLTIVAFSGCFSNNHYDRLILIPLIVAIFWIAHRYEHVGVTLATLVISSIALWSTIHGLGPFSEVDLNDALILLVSVIAIVSLVGLVLSSDRLQNATERHDSSTSWFTLFASLSLTIFVWHLVSLTTESKAQEKFLYQVNEIKTKIEQRVKIYEELLKSGVGLFAASKSVEREEWQKFYGQLNISKNYAGAQGFGFAKYLQKKDSESFINSIKKEGFPEFHIFPEGGRSEYVVIQYLEPLTWRNKRAFGYDMFSEPTRRKAMEDARDTGQAFITGKVTLVQEDGKDVQPGYLMYVPVYLNGAQPSSVIERRKLLIGYVYCPFRSNELIQEIVANNYENLSLEIFDGSTTKPEHLLYASKESSSIKSNLFSFKENLKIKVSNHIWSAQIISKPGFEISIDRSKEQIILIAGFLISLLLFMHLRSLSLNNRSAELLAKQMTVALQGAEAKFGSLAESANEGIIVASDDGTILYCNNAASTIFGYAPGDLFDQNLTKIMPERFHSAHNQGMLRINNKGQARILGRTIELVGLNKEGNEFPLELSLSTWESNNQKFYGALIRDIVKRKQAEDDLRSLSDRLLVATDAVGAGIWDLDIQTKTLLCDDKMHALYQIERDSKSNSLNLWEERVHPDFSDQVSRELNHSIQTGSPFKTEFSLLLPSGETRNIRARALVKKDAHGKPVQMVGINMDITEEKLREEALRNSEQRFRNTLENAPIGMALVSPEGRWLECNEALCKIVGYTRDDLMHLTFQDITHPDDLESDLTQVKNLLSGEIQSYQMQKRYIHKDGKIVWVLLAVCLIRDASNKPQYFISQIENIDALKNAELKLQESERRFRLLIDGVKEYAIYLVDKTGIVLTWNAGAEKNKGYKAEEIIGQNFSAFFLPEDRAKKIPEHELELAEKRGRFEAEGWRIRKDGSRFWASVLLTAIRDENNEIIGFAKITRDLTHERDQKLQLQNSLKEKETLLKEVYHRVKNNLQVVTSMFNLQTRILPEGQARDVLTQAALRVFSMSLVHEKLYRSKSLASIDLNEYISDLCKHFSEASALDERGIRFILSLQHMEVDLDTAIPVGLILNELISNSIKHAFKGRKEGTISITLSSSVDGKVELTVTDDGLGYEVTSMTKRTTLGLKLVDSLCRQLDADMHNESAGGMQTCIRFNRKSPRSHF